MRQAWLRKVENLAIIPCTEGVTALFRSTLNILNLRRKVSEWKSGNGVQTAQVKELRRFEQTFQRPRQMRALLMAAKQSIEPLCDAPPCKRSWNCCPH